MRAGSLLRVAATIVVAACSFKTSGGTPGVDAPGGGPADARRDGTTGPLDAPQGGVGPRLVQETKNYVATGQTTAATFAAPPGNGHLLVLVGAAEHGALVSVTGGGVASWSRAAQSLQNSNIEIWYGVTDGSGSTVTITFQAGNVLPLWLDVSEWSGMATSNLLDGAVATAGTSSPASAGSITTTHASDLVVFGVSDSAPNAWGAPMPGGWASLQMISQNVITQGAWYRAVTATGAYAPGVTETAHAWDAAVAAFRVAP